MDIDDQVIGTIYSRREALVTAARAGFGLAVGGGMLNSPEIAQQAQAQKQVHLVASPALTEGPFFVDERLNRSDLVAGTTRPSVAQAHPLELAVVVYRLASDGNFSPMPDVVVDIWSADAHGVYSDEPGGQNPERTIGEHWLRGYQITDKAGKANFRTIIPSRYPGRTTHIHFKIRKSLTGASAEFTSQLFFEDEFADAIFKNTPYRTSSRDTHNLDDGIYCERQVDGTMAGQHLTLHPKSINSGKGHRADFSIALNDSSFRTGGNQRGPGGQGQGGRGPGSHGRGGFGGRGGGNSIF